MTNKIEAPQFEVEKGEVKSKIISSGTAAGTHIFIVYNSRLDEAVKLAMQFHEISTVSEQSRSMKGSDYRKLLDMTDEIKI